VHWALVVAAGIGVFVLLEVALRWLVGIGLETDFYGSIPREVVRAQQVRHGLRVATGPGWAHLGWIADPERERYRIERLEGLGWSTVARSRLGSSLVRTGGDYRVWAEPRRGDAERLVGEVEVSVEGGDPPLHRPRVAGPWRLLFRPERVGSYVNDHAVFRDAQGRFRLLGITGPGRGDYSRERRFAQGVSEDFPPAAGMREDEPVADFGELAWAPAVVEHDGVFHLFWSPHRLHHMTSRDGVRWSEPRLALRAPAHGFFRDATVLEVAPGQWLLFATGRGRWFSRVDVYQSFDLEEWQYVGAVLRARPGSERNSAFASTESPQVTCHAGRYYLSITYNNGSRLWAPLLLLLRRAPRGPEYHDTLVFHSDNPYDFGSYAGARRSPTLLARLEAHAPRLFRHPETGAWWITTAGWPWAATLTSGEVAVAPLAWDRVEGSDDAASKAGREGVSRPVR
jgi:beta-fructofuranosidase